MQYFCTVKPKLFFVMKKTSPKKLSFNELSPERRVYSTLLSYILERVYDPYTPDEFFKHHFTDGVEFPNFYLGLINDSLKDL